MVGAGEVDHEAFLAVYGDAQVVRGVQWGGAPLGLDPVRAVLLHRGWGWWGRSVSLLVVW
ncbi:hypothetical protein GCM10028793_64850 [Nocardiopsis oceani]